LTEEGKSDVAASAQSIILANIGQYKDLEVSEYQSGIFLTVYDGVNITGCSKALNKKEYKWY